MRADLPTKMMRTVEAVLLITTATVFSSGARVGIGRGVGVVGGGPARGLGVRDFNCRGYMCRTRG